ncbi:SusC/RagA family TonB-linked outer membrane protein [Aureibacter tunicatorum]|uniref:TonB-linked SusC/RagA family outer membrane protein n=1 Tax=Aureibacter tunicatorum TaxID=866807 RepID=A0AAE3XNR6_9BACT|nr:SusC/RagA family TonB-linked outer membrane protein [Aureibacter tunicatorum]MDR6240332.1 TonB-linked SusC/RagA family outer membrane protein [Aureibacter tunicatorum]BDD05787.1 SusC/RagA family TonB-linked outer membrane protein [Aureibacter tunicatorum]
MRKFLLKAIRRLNMLSTTAFCFLMVMICMPALASNNELDQQRVTMEVKGETLEMVFSMIESQTGFKFIYKKDERELSRKLTFSADQTNLTDVLKDIESQTGASFKQIKNNISVRFSNGRDGLADQAQGVERRIAGRVLDDEIGEPLIGATVLEAGTTNGTITDLDGTFELMLTENASMIIVSYIGYAEQAVEVSNRTNFEIKLKQDLSTLNEVVVTAIGIEREKAKLGYAITEVSGSEIASSVDNNVFSSLKGKVPGMVINSSTGGSTGSSSVILRGYSTVQGDNQALIVVDGIPYSNNSFGQGSSGNGIDLGSGIGDLNPEDIESVTVLKGANASALYGSRAINGAVVITTKKGTKKKGLGVQISSSMVIREIAFTPDLQNEYGQGGSAKTLGEFDGVDDDGTPYLPKNNDKSWGAKFEGQDVRVKWIREEPIRKYEAQPDNYKNFFQTGVNFINNVSITGATDKASVRMNVLANNLKDIVPTSKQDKYGLSLRATQEIAGIFDLDAKLAYTTSSTHNRLTLGNQRGAYSGLVTGPRSFYLEDLKRYRYPVTGVAYNEHKTFGDNMPVAWSTSTGSSAGNPYWELYENPNDDKQDRLNGMVKLSAQILPGLRAFGRIGWDNSYMEARKVAEKYSRYYRFDGQMTSSSGIRTELNTDFLISYDKEFGSDFSMSVNAGGNRRKEKTTYKELHGTHFTVVDFNSFNNIEQKYQHESEVERAVNSVYGMLAFSYKNIANLDATLRSDWTSTLPSGNNSFLYPSVSGSFVFSEAFDWRGNILSFGKLRASYAEVGNDTQPYMTKRFYNFNNDELGRAHASLPSNVWNEELKPERNKSVELGLDMGLINDRVSLDLTWYQSNVVNQILPSSPLAISSGYSSWAINAGEIQNTGVELGLSVIPVRLDKFQWRAIFNYAQNNSKVVEFNEDTDQIVLGTGRGVTVLAKKDKPFGAIYGRAFLRNEAGVVIVDENGYPMYEEEDQIIGNVMPDFTGSLANEFSYGNWRLSALVDMSFGGEITSWSETWMNLRGTTSKTLEGRDAWIEARENGNIHEEHLYSTEGGYGAWVGNSVYEDGTPNAGENAKYLNPFMYWDEMKKDKAGESTLVDASYVKLREVSLTYDLTSIANKVGLSLQGASLSFTGRNLFLLYSESDLFDPDSYRFSTSTNSLGVESGAWPSTRSYAFTFKASF